MKPWLRNAIIIAAIVLITACVSIASTITILNARQGEMVLLEGEAYERYRALLPLLELMETIQAEHYGDELKDEDLIDGALRGITESMGDPYARYYTEEEYLSYLRELDGSYSGIGLVVGQLQKDANGVNGLPVLKVYSESPAEEAGLLAGDFIVMLDGQTIRHMALEEIDALFAGEEGSTLTLTLLRAAQEFEVSVTRAKIVAERVTHKLFLERTGYIRVEQFSGSASEEFSEAIHDLVDRGMRSLVVDLRSNPGGELKQVVAMANELLNDRLIVSVRSTNGENEEFFADKRYVDIPMAVLVNERSASASEIFAAAIQECGRGIVVGCKTYGKGVVQSTQQLKSNLGWIKMTTAAYFTPLGNSVHEKGVTPDIDIDIAEELKTIPIEQIAQDDDAQLWAALDVVREQADTLESGQSNAAPSDDEADDQAA